MTKFTRLRLIVVASALLSVLFSPALCLARSGSAQTESKSAILAAISQVRVANGLAPLALNPALEKAAQEHSDDMANKGYVDHVGSDSSSPTDRINSAGYPAWSSTRVAGEVVYAGDKGFSDALTFLLKDDAQRRILLNSHFREIGIGFTNAPNANGVQTTYWTLTFGAQPNVLPIFVNDGATLINVPQVAIHLTQEDAVPNGESNAIGNVLEVRVSSDSSFKGVNWQKWEALIPFTFDKMPGLKTVYVQFRDGGGRTTISTVSVQYDPNSTPQVAPLGPGVQVSAVPVTDVVIDDTPTPFVTVVSLGTSVSTGRVITPVAQVTAIVLVVTPPVAEEPVPTPIVSPTPSTRTLVDRPDAILPDWLLPLYLLTQGAVIVLGAVAFFRMKR
jgi:uncharacterized protein YkwD